MFRQRVCSSPLRISSLLEDAWRYILPSCAREVGGRGWKKSNSSHTRARKRPDANLPTPRRPSTDCSYLRNFFSGISRPAAVLRWECNLDTKDSAGGKSPPHPHGNPETSRYRKVGTQTSIDGHHGWVQQLWLQCLSVACST